MRADALFANLTRRQSMLLLTAVTFGGPEAHEALRHVSEDDATALLDRAAKLLAIPREQRIPFLLQEIKKLVVGRKGGDIRGASPERAAAALRGERPALAEVLLRGLPAGLAEQVRNEIPPVSVRLKREVRPEVLTVTRWYFERRLEGLSPQQASFLFADVYQLSGRDLLTLSDGLGAEEVGPVLAALPHEERQAVLEALSADQRSLVARGSRAETSSRVEAAGATSFFEQLAAPDARYQVRYAGLRTIARACLAESADLAGRLAERHRDDLGRMLVSAIRAERSQGQASNPEELQAQVVAAMEHLARLGMVERPMRLPSPASTRHRVTSRGTPGKRSAAPLPIPAPPSRRQPTDPLGPDGRPRSSPKGTPPPRRTAPAREYPAAQGRDGRTPRAAPRPRGRGPGSRG